MTTFDLPITARAFGLGSGAAMPRFNPGKCFYCRVGFNKPKPNQKGLSDTNPTIDHVYPDLPGIRLPSQLTDRNSIHGKVRACHYCNFNKGKMHPLTWLTMVENNDGAADLAGLLLKLGEPEQKVKTALARRKVLLHAR